MRIHDIDNIMYNLLYKLECVILSIWFKTNRLDEISQIHLFNRDYGKVCYFVWNSLYDGFKGHRKLVYELISGNMKHMLKPRSRSV